MAYAQDRRSPTITNKLRRAVWPWVQAHAMSLMLRGMLCGALASVSTVLVYLHGFR